MKRAILLLHMGGSNNLDEVEVFLNNMFNDKRIISAPQPIRLDEAKVNYAHLGGKSPIVGYTQELIVFSAHGLPQRIIDKGGCVPKTPNAHPEFVQALTQIYEEMRAQ